MVYVKYKVDKLLGWSFLVVLLILSGVYFLIKKSAPTAVMQTYINVMLGVDGLTLLIDIVHCIRHGLSCEHRVYYTKE